MLLRFICRAVLSNPQNSAVFNPPPSMAVLSHHRYYSKQNNKKQDNNKNNKSKSKSKSKPSDSASSSILQSESATSAAADDSESSRARARLLSIDERDPSLDVGPNNRPLFTSTTTLSSLTRSDACTYFKFSEEELKAAIPEGLPAGLVAEFRESMRPALLVRKSFVDIRDNLDESLILP